MKLLSVIGIALGLGLMASAFSAENPAIGAHGPSQAAADAIRAQAGTDGAFLAAGLVKETFQRDRLETILQYPTEEIVVLNLTGEQIWNAFERSLSLFPQANTSFLQISGFEVTFGRTASPNERVKSVNAGTAAIDRAKTYSVAMPASLGRGGLGYFKIWNKSNLVRTLEGVTVESVLRGKAASDSSPRWLPQG